MKKISAVMLLIIGFIATSFILKYDDGNPWNVPEAAKNKKNPIATSAASIAEGKSLWNLHCKSCHGAKGLGDGNKAAQLKTEPGNFSLAATQSQTDGSLFYKTTEGRDDMPGFKKKIPDEDDRWHVVNYMRTFKK